MNFDNGDGSGIRRLTDTQRLELMRAMETEDCLYADDAELSTFAVPPLVPLPPPPAAEAAARQPLVEPRLHGFAQCEAYEIEELFV